MPGKLQPAPRHMVNRSFSESDGQSRRSFCCQLFSIADAAPPRRSEHVRYRSGSWTPGKKVCAGWSMSAGELPSVAEIATKQVASQQFLSFPWAPAWLEEHATADRPCSTYGGIGPKRSRSIRVLFPDGIGVERTKQCDRPGVKVQLF